MSHQIIKIAEPFFPVYVLKNETQAQIKTRAIVLNLGDNAIEIEDQKLHPLQSVVIINATLNNVEEAIVIEGFDQFEDEDALFKQVREIWPKAFDIRKEERLRGVEHYLSPKVSVGNKRFSMYHSASVPLNVGLHKDHPFCDVPGFCEVHTQVVGYGKMQQCREKDLSTLYMEELMAPGTTHRPMYDEEGNYPWHQFETITPSIFMAVEILPEGMEA